MARASQDELIDALNRANPYIDFLPATDEVVRGHDLKSSGNRYYGKNVYVATHEPPDLDLSPFLLGRLLSPGYAEPFPACSLRLEKAGHRITAALFDGAGAPVSRTLSARARKGEVDEALLAWFGPLEDICTPWSDNDPPQCQVVTVDRLRAFGRDWRG